MENVVMIKGPVAENGRQKWGNLPVPRIIDDIVGCRCSGKNLIICEHACYLNI
jgi:hypothetical protein